MRLSVVAIAVLAATGASRAQSVAPHPGLVLNYAHKQTDRDDDREFLVTVVAVDSDETILKSYFLDDADGAKPVYPDTVSRREWLGARALTAGAGTNPLERERNRTVMALSKRAYQQLKRDGKLDEVAIFVVLGDVGQNVRVSGMEELVGAEPLTVVFDGRQRTLSALHVKGHWTSMSPMLDVTGDVWYLDDSAAAWVLKMEEKVQGRDYHVRLGSVNTSPPDQAKVIDASLAGAGCRAQIYGIYFPYNSATVTAASQPTLALVAGVLKAHADWTVTIEGHTDSIGGVQYNQQLAARRAAAVKAQLVDAYGIPAARLTTAGIGLARPLASNATLEGRARNRRVELVRKCGS